MGSTTTTTDGGRRQGKVCLYHPRKDENGSAIQLDMRLNRSDERRYDCFFLSIANQNGTQKAGDRLVASFDWDKKSVVKLGFADICELLAVLEGKKEAAGNGKGGLFHQSGDGNTVLGFSKGTDAPGYNLSVSRKNSQGEQVFRSHIFVTESEAIGIRSILQASLLFLSFHYDLLDAEAP